MVTLTDEQFSTLMSTLTRIAEGVESLKQMPKPETYGIRPDAMYSDKDLQDKFGVSEKVTRIWRNEYGLKFFQRQKGVAGSRISHLGQDVIDFYTTYHEVLTIKQPKAISRDFPKGNK